MSEAPDIDAIVAGFSTDMPAGYEARLQRQDAELQLLARRGGEEWTFVVAIGLDAAAESIPWMLSTCQGELIEHDFGEAWPRCPQHGGHPLQPAQDGWHCPLNAHDGPIWPFGSLSDTPVPPDPPREDGEVRWYYDDLGWGVIAHRQGDLFVLFASINMDGYRSLSEGQRVDFDIASGQQGRFRRAENVTPYSSPA